MELLAFEKRRPLIIGCQHGFMQLWDVWYWSRACFDYFFVFGRHFIKFVPSYFRNWVVAAGLPKLDLIQPAPRGDFQSDKRPILFAAQTRCTPRLTKALRKLETASGRTLIVRPHPEAREAFDGLRTEFGFADLKEPLLQQMERASLLITTGSTTVLEAIAAEIPVVVLPEQWGELYDSAGIVAGSMDASEVLEIACGQSRPSRRAGLNRYLEEVSGSRHPDRALLVVECVERLVRDKLNG
jgi:hypothetical protein